MKNTKLLSVLIPVHNSEKTIKPLIGQIVERLKLYEISHEIILVDDYSTDASWVSICDITELHKAVKGVKLPMHYGQQRALYEGLHYCQGEYTLTMDDDGQHDISRVVKMLAMAEQGYDLIFGIYRCYETNWLRKWGSFDVGRFFKRRFPNLKNQQVSSFRLMHRSVYRPILGQSVGFIYLSAEILPYAKCVGNVEIPYRPRWYGKSGYKIQTLVAVSIQLKAYYGRLNFKRFRRQKKSETHINGWREPLSNQRHQENTGNGI